MASNLFELESYPASRVIHPGTGNAMCNFKVSPSIRVSGQVRSGVIEARVVNSKTRLPVKTENGHVKYHIVQNRSEDVIVFKDLVVPECSSDSYLIEFECQSYDPPFAQLISGSKFSVRYDRQAISSEPRITAINPPYGVWNKPNEVWIRGKNFYALKGIKVLFGQREVEYRCTWGYELIIVIVPPMIGGIAQDVTVPITVIKDGVYNCTFDGYTYLKE